MTKRHAVVVGMTLLVVAVLVVVRKREVDPFEAEIQDLQRATVRAGGLITSISPPTKAGLSVEASWDVTTELDWDAYEQTLATSMPAGYSLQDPEENQSRLFVKELPGDHLLFEITVISVGSPLRLRGVFVARAW